MNSTGMVKARRISAGRSEYGAIRSELSHISEVGLEFNCCLCDLGICNRNCDFIKRFYSRNKQYANAMKQISMISGNPEWKSGWIYMPPCGSQGCIFLKQIGNVFSEAKIAGFSSVALYYGMKSSEREAFVLQVGVDFAIFMKSGWVGGALMAHRGCPYYDLHFVTAGQLK